MHLVQKRSGLVEIADPHLSSGQTHTRTVEILELEPEAPLDLDASFREARGDVGGVHLGVAYTGDGHRDERSASPDPLRAA